MHKYGIEIPKNYDDSVRIDHENGNTLWQDAIHIEMAPPTYQQMHCKMVYDVKMEDFRCRARFAAGGHMTETPATNTYASVVSQELVHIALTLAALINLKVKTADIKNAYLTAPVSERIWCVLGLESGADAGKCAIVVWSLYGLKSAGASFWNHLADCMWHLG